MWPCQFTNALSLYRQCSSISFFKSFGNETKTDVVILGGGLGGCAAAMAACRQGASVILTEPTDWIGGQVSQQGVPPDEHQWIETIARNHHLW